jgi:hypothetical protein
MVFLLEIYNLRLKQGEPLTVHQLKKKVLYTIHGRGKFIANNGQLEKKVLFVMDSSLLNPKIISVILPVELSEGTWRFYVIQDYDELGTQIEHQGAIVAFIDDDSNSQANYKKILFPWNSKQSKSQK